MLNYDEFFQIPPYSLNKMEKTKLLDKYLNKLTKHHYENCIEYKNIIDYLKYNVDNYSSYESIPFLPVRLFKELELKSVSNDKVIKQMTSSGTTGQLVSKIYLDKHTASLQQKALVRIVSNFTGTSRSPMLIIDSKEILKNRSNFSARAAGILGFSIFGKDITYALDENMEINVECISNFLNKHKGEQIIVFGFTYMIWEFFVNKLSKLENNQTKIDLKDSILIHGGGWKKLSNLNITSNVFKEQIRNTCMITNVHDYYGMVEQTGSIYMECEEGHLHTSIFSDVIIRRGHDLSIADFNEMGIIQVVSVLPLSYCGHSLLTEDEGVILGEDDCACGRKGKYFKVFGRIKNAEIRGCSDTYDVKD